MTVGELLTILEQLPQQDLVCVQATHNGFSACCSVVSDCGVTYIRDHVLMRLEEMVCINGQYYNVIQTTTVRDGKVLSWSARIK